MPLLDLGRLVSVPDLKRRNTYVPLFCTFIILFHFFLTEILKLTLYHTIFICWLVFLALGSAKDTCILGELSTLSHQRAPGPMGRQMWRTRTDFRKKDTWESVSFEHQTPRRD